MVQVALLGGSSAWREPAGPVARDDKFGDPWWWAVSLGGQLVGASAGAPVLLLPVRRGCGGAPRPDDCPVQDHCQLVVADRSCRRGTVGELVHGGDESHPADQANAGCSRLGVAAWTA